MIAALVVVAIGCGLMLAGSYLQPRCPRVDRLLHLALGGTHASWSGEVRHDG